MSTIATAAPSQPMTALRHRRDARQLTEGQAADLRRAITLTQGITDDRGYQAWAGIHGLPLPISCTHHTPLFLPWHRAYLYLFEKALQDQVPGVTLPWWDWTRHDGTGIPPSYSDPQDSGQGPNPLLDSPIQPGGREDPAQVRTTRSSGPAGDLPSRTALDGATANSDFMTFQTQLESIHDQVHVWVGGTMSDIATAAYDPLFWAHHCMIDRAWYLWQLEHPGAGPPASLLHQALAPFPMTVADTLSIDQLGYDYAAASTAVAGP